MKSRAIAGPRRRAFLPLTLCVAFVVLLGVPEVVLRIIDPPLSGFRAMDFGGDANTPLLFIEDPVYRWRLRSSTEVEFLGSRVRTNARGLRGEPIRRDVRSILCVGGSTTFGWRVADEDTFPRQLQSLLSDGPGGWQVVNAGVPGYSSFQTALVTEELLGRLQPDVLVILVGNNEGWPAERSDRQLYEDHRLRAKIVRTLSASKTLVWLKETLRPGQPRDFRPFGLEDAGPRVSREEYIFNVRRMISLGREYTSRVVVVSPPMNLYHKPVRLEDFLDDAAGASGEWDDVWELSKRGEIDHALGLVDAALADDPDRMDMLWLRGMLLSQAGKMEEGRTNLEEAIEKHPYPERIRPSYQRALAQLADDEGVTFIDAPERFRAASPVDNPMILYQDWCHPTAAGHRVIAEAIHGVLGQES